MPRLERSVLIGYGVEVRRGKGQVPSGVGEGGSIVFETIDVTELVFSDHDGDQVIFPMSEEGRVELVEKLTGGVVIP